MEAHLWKKPSFTLKLSNAHTCEQEADTLYCLCFLPALAYSFPGNLAPTDLSGTYSMSLNFCYPEQNGIPSYSSSGWVLSMHQIWWRVVQWCHFGLVFIGICTNCTNFSGCVEVGAVHQQSAIWCTLVETWLLGLERKIWKRNRNSDSHTRKSQGSCKEVDNYDFLFLKIAKHTSPVVPNLHGFFI